MNRGSKANFQRLAASRLTHLMVALFVGGGVANVAVAACELGLPVLASNAAVQNVPAEVPSVSVGQALGNRLIAVAILVGVVVAMVAVVYGYLKLELVTRGFYSGRLQFAAAVVSLTIAACAYLLWVALTSG